MLSHAERQLESQLAGAGATKVKIEGKSLKKFIQETLAEQIALARKTKLTWRKGEIDEPADAKKRVGKLRLDKPYIGPIGRGRWYVQNMRVFTAAGQPLKDFSPISTDKVIEHVADRTGKTTEVKFPSEMERVQEALTFYAKSAAANDPNLCPYCFAYSEANRKLMTQHLFKQHPKEFQAEMAEESGAAPEEELEAVATK